MTEPHQLKIMGRMSRKEIRQLERDCREIPRFANMKLSFSYEGKMTILTWKE